MNINDDTTGGITATQLGDNACAFATETVAIGKNSTSGKSIDSEQNPYAIAIGAESNSSGRASIALGASTKASASSSISIGFNSNSSASTAFAMGYESKASDIHTISIGDAANSTKQTSFALGYHSATTGKHSVAIGDQANATGLTSFSLGYHTNANNDHSCALGDQAIATGTGSLSIGYKSVATGKNSVAIGIESNASHENSIAIGPNSITLDDNQICLGNTDSIITIPGDLQIKINDNLVSLIAKDATSDPTADGDFVGQFSYTDTYARIWDGTQWKNIGDGLTEVTSYTANYQYNNNPGLNLHKTLNAYNTTLRPTGFNVSIAILSDGIPPTHTNLAQKVICGGDFGEAQPDFYKNIVKDSAESTDYWFGAALASICSGNRLKDFQWNLETDQPIQITNNCHGYAFDSKVIDIRTIDIDNSALSTLNWTTVGTDILNAYADIVLQTHENIIINRTDKAKTVDLFNIDSGITQFDLTTQLENTDSLRGFYKSLQDKEKIQVWPAGDFGHTEIEFQSAYPYISNTNDLSSLTNPNIISYDCWIAVVSVDENGTESLTTNRAGRCADFTVAAHGANVPFALIPGDTGLGYGYDTVSKQQKELYTKYDTNPDSGTNTINDMQTNSGTSFAAAAVSGAIAIVGEAKQNTYNNAQIVQLLLNTASYDDLSIRYTNTDTNALNTALDANNVTTVKNILLGDKYADDSSYSNSANSGKDYTTTNNELFADYDYVKSKIGQTNADEIFKAVFGKGLINIEDACNATL
jgi:hypothetical protein